MGLVRTTRWIDRETLRFGRGFLCVSTEVIGRANHLSIVRPLQQQVRTCVVDGADREELKTAIPDHHHSG